MKTFQRVELIEVFQPFSDLINRKTNDDEKLLDTSIRSRLKASNTVSPHGTDGRVLQYHIWDREQPDIFAKKHFKYEVQHDPVQRYSGTANTNFSVQFYMNKIRLYHEREEIILRIRRELSRLKIKGFSLGENTQAIYFHSKFYAENAKVLQSLVKRLLFPLLNKVHPIFYKIMDAFNVLITKAQRSSIIQGRKRVVFINRDSPAYGKNPEFNRNVPSALRVQVFKRDKFSCQHCGKRKTSVYLHADHIIPFALGGLTVLKNLQALCGPCNLKKGKRLDSQLKFLS